MPVEIRVPPLGESVVEATVGRSAGDVLALTEHYYAGIADVEAPGPVLLVVDADAHAGRHDDAFVDDDPTQLSAAADIDAVQQHGAFDDRAAVHLDAWRQNRLAHLTAGDDAAG